MDLTQADDRARLYLKSVCVLYHPHDPAAQAAMAEALMDRARSSPGSLMEVIDGAQAEFLQRPVPDTWARVQAICDALDVMLEGPTPRADAPAPSMRRAARRAHARKMKRKE